MLFKTRQFRQFTSFLLKKEATLCKPSTFGKNHGKFSGKFCISHFFFFFFQNERIKFLAISPSVYGYSCPHQPSSKDAATWCYKNVTYDSFRKVRKKSENQHF